MKAKILIVEDEMIIAAKISLQLTQMGYEVVGVMPRGEEAVQHCQVSPPDLVLLDIQLKGDIDGIETAKQIRLKHDLPIIFLTANADHLHFEKAKETRPHAFISKPFRKLDLRRAVQLALVNRESNPTANDHEDLPVVLEDRIFIRQNEALVKVLLSDIKFVEAERSYCRIHCNNSSYLLSMPLKKLEECLPGNQFIRIHRSYLVNLQQIEEVVDMEVVLKGAKIPISKAHREVLLRRLRMF